MSPDCESLGWVGRRRRLILDSLCYNGVCDISLIRRASVCHVAFQDRIVGAVSALLMNSATTQAVAVDGGIPDPIRLIWMTRGGDRDPSPQQWADYDASAKDFNTVTSIFRPGFVGGAGPSDTIAELSRYRAHWLVARTAEHIGGWATRPLPLPDMVYAAIAVETGRTRELVETQC